METYNYILYFHLITDASGMSSAQVLSDKTSNPLGPAHSSWGRMVGEIQVCAQMRTTGTSVLVLDPYFRV